MDKIISDRRRRSFLFTAGAGSAVAVGAAVISAVPEAQKVAKVAPIKTGAYQESEHIRDYYDSARM